MKNKFCLKTEAVLLLNVLINNIDIDELINNYQLNLIKIKYLKEYRDIYTEIVKNAQHILENNNDIVIKLDVFLKNKLTSDIGFLIGHAIFFRNLDIDDIDFDKYVDFFVNNFIIEIDSKVDEFNLQSILEEVMLLNIDDNSKLQIIDFLLNIKENFNQLMNLIRDLYNHITKYEDRLVPIMEYYSNYLNKDIVNLKEFNNYPISYSENEILLIFFTPFIKGNLNTYDLNDNLFILGIFNYDKWKYIDKLKNKEWFINTLKAISDPLRLQIIKKSSKKTVYQNELAKELNIKPSTLAHHINLLATSELVKIVPNKNNKKIYYEVNDEKLEELSKEILNLRKIND